MNIFNVVFLTALSGCCCIEERALNYKVRIATYNVSLSRSKPEQLYRNLKAGDKQATAIADVIKIVRPDILLLNEFDFTSEHKSILYFRDHYLAASQNCQKPIVYPYYYTTSVNTGVPSGYDLDNDGKVGGPDDAFGYGQFPGQYGLVLFSRYPIKVQSVRTFQNFLWKDMPNAMLPDDPGTLIEGDWYSPQELTCFRLSSKSHCDIPVDISGNTVHFLISHPTPPVFDGPEDSNGRRNHDEIRFWADYINNQKSNYIYDDHGKTGGLAFDSFFVILGDLNSDPCDGDSTNAAVNQLLLHPDIQDPKPSSKGAVQATHTQQGFNTTHSGLCQYDTYQSQPEKSPGNLRLDYVLPSVKIKVINSGVFWPMREKEVSGLIKFSDHRMVYVDIMYN